MFFSRPGLGNVIDHAEYMEYGVGLIPYAVPGLALLIATIAASIGWCCCACKSKEATNRSQRGNWVMRFIVYDLLLLSAVTASIMFVVLSTRGLSGVISDAQLVVDAVLSRADSVNGTITEIKSQGLNLAPSVEVYFDSGGHLQAMQPAFDAELLALNRSRDEYPQVQGQIEGILSTSHEIKLIFQTNNTDIALQVDDVLRQIADARAELVDKREQPLIHDIDYYNSTFVMPVLVSLMALLYVLASLTALSKNNSGCLWRMGQLTTPALLFMCLFAMIVIPFGRVLEDGCEYVRDQEVLRVTPHSNSSLERTAYACLYNQSLLTVADVNITKILDIDQWATFPAAVPVFPITTPGVNATLEEIRVNATQAAMDLVQNVRVVLDPLLQSVRQGSANAVCDTIGGRVFDLRDRVCKLPGLLTWLSLSMVGVVLFMLIAVSLRACRRKTEGGGSYDKVGEEEGTDAQ